jgi:hypothetical protein
LSLAFNLTPHLPIAHNAELGPHYYTGCGISARLYALSRILETGREGDVLLPSFAYTGEEGYGFDDVVD